MSEYKRLTDEELNDFTSRVVVQLEPTLTQQVMSLILELSEYRNKIENGTLIELPCKVGDTVYSIPFDDDKEIFKHKVKALRLLFISEADDCDFIENNFAWWGENIFSTKAEAEKKLKELKNER